MDLLTYVANVVTGPRRARLYVTLALLTFFLTPWANSVAAEPLSVVKPYPAGDFALRFARYRADFDYPTRDIDTTVEWIGVRWQEKLNSRVHGSLFGGWTTLTQDNTTPRPRACACGVSMPALGCMLIFSVASALVCFFLPTTHCKTLTMIPTHKR